MVGHQNKRQLLICDPHLVQKVFTAPGLSSETASTLNEARAAIQEEMPLVVCCDLDLPDGSGMDFLDEVRITDKKLPFILVSCHDKDDYEQDQFNFLILKNPALGLPNRGNQNQVKALLQHSSLQRPGAGILRMDKEQLMKS